MNERLIIVFIQIVLVFSLITIITFLIRINSAYKLEKRISKYTLKTNRKENISISNKIWNKYLYFVKSQRKKIKQLFPTYTKKYDKYVNNEQVIGCDFVTNKIIIAILFSILAIITRVVQGRFITILEFIIIFIIGFYILDIILFIESKINKKKIQNDMLKAIIIMNNAFKSGKSTIQTLEIASKKLPNPIGYEFKKIYEEMKYGLSLDEVFDRFAKRVKIEEAEYLSSSLIILNKTGGNIIKVFDSIEKTLFDKKKLEEELKNSTTVSKLVVKILTIIPIIFIFIIYLFDPSYFDPFFQSTLGYILLLIILLMFIIYACLLRKIVKVEY